MEKAEFTHHQRRKRALPLHHNNTNYLVMKLAYFGAMRILLRFLVMGLLAIIITFPSWKDLIGSASLFSHPIALQKQGSSSNNAEIMSLLLHNLETEPFSISGRTNNKVVAAFVSRVPDFADGDVYRSRILNDFDVKVVPVHDLEKQSKIPDGHFDLVFADEGSAFNSASEFIDRSVKIGGIVAVKIGRDDDHHPSSAFAKPSNYRTVHFRRFQYGTVLVLQKIAKEHPRIRRRRLFSYGGDRKAAALENLEDVLLEPPRAKSRKSWRYRKKTRYLPDLMGDSLEGYPRRVFIDVGGSEGGTKWFMAHYPTRNLDFEMYRIEMLSEELDSEKENDKTLTTTAMKREKEEELVMPEKENDKMLMTTATKTEEEEELVMSDWMRKNVRGEEYVVMKAEAEVVEELAKSKAIRLVDELFLECKLPKNGSGGSRRAYWECLALYGKLRDEGVAVHQWWG